ncbi:terminase gpA endonuclease subunit [Methylobacterium gnaphalii]|nr:terminase gpA endonuclease subunit [Methylobacterium gnaphalii]
MVAGGLARALEPVIHMPVSEYLEKHVVLIDGPLAGQYWSREGAPYLVEIADCLGEDHPCNLVTVRKSQQTGVSVLGLGWCLYVADREPANLIYAIPGTDALKDLAGQKLGPMIEAWHGKLDRTVIEPQTSRSGVGSTTFEKKFAGGYVTLGNANSAMDLSSKTTKKGVKDELSKWEDIPGRGDPEDLYMGRFTAFRRTKDWKILEISTPEVDTGSEDGTDAGHCRIDRSFKAGDQRYWNIACPNCGSFFYHEVSRLKIDRENPDRSRYSCPHCEHPVSEGERVIAVREGRWIPLRGGEGRHPSFHVDAFISLMMSYGEIAKEVLKAEKAGTESAKKGLYNLTLGLPHKYRGDAPDHRRLLERRESGLVQKRIPVRGLLLTGAADVQMRGIWYEIVAHAPNRETWSIDHGYLDGDTSSPDAPVFAELRRVLERQYVDAYGRKRSVDAFAVDSGYRSHVVYSWVRKVQTLHPWTGRDIVLAVKGQDGWPPPPIGTPTLVDIDLDGKKVKQGCKLWPVGTWSLKAGFYSDLHKLGIRSGQLVDPDGYCHFGDWHDENYFKQVTSEYLVDVKVLGKAAARKWEVSGDNHLLDCRIYNLALAEYLGLSSTSPEEWAEVARRRGLPDELTTPDLFRPQHRLAPDPDGSAGPGDEGLSPPPADIPSVPPAVFPPPPVPDDDWFGGSSQGWFER